MTDHQIEHLLITKGVDKDLIDMSIEDAIDAITKLYPEKLEGFQKTLKYLEYQGIKHGDLHSGNVMVDTNGNIYIIDFGSVQTFNPLQK